MGAFNFKGNSMGLNSIESETSKNIRVSGDLEIYVNRVDLRIITYRLLTKYAPKHTKKESTEFVEIINFKYFHNHIDYIQLQNSWKIASNYVIAYT